MTIRLSSALRDAVITNYGLGYCLNDGHILLFSGAQPASADADEPDSLVGFITMGGFSPTTSSAGLRFTGGTKAGELSMIGDWVVTATSPTPPTWWRCVRHSAIGTLSIDGAVDGDGMQLELSGWAPMATTPVTEFLMVLPGQ